MIGNEICNSVVEVDNCGVWIRVFLVECKINNPVKDESNKIPVIIYSNYNGNVISDERLHYQL